MAPADHEEPPGPGWHLAYIGLGANLGDPAAQLRQALARLSRVPGVKILRVSAFYLTPPVGVLDQPWFINAAVKVATSLEPVALLETLLQIEADLGRIRTSRWGPRLVDLDLLLYNRLIMTTPKLTLPHPEMHRRAFVLIPLAEIAPQAFHPGLGQTVSRLLATLPEADKAVVKKLAPAASEPAGD